MGEQKLYCLSSVDIETQLTSSDCTSPGLGRSREVVRNHSRKHERRCCLQRSLDLYNQAGYHRMVVEILREMENNNMEPEGVSIRELLVSFAKVSDIKGMKRFEKKLKGKPGAMPVWDACVRQGMTYLKAGPKEKALAMLGRSESLVEVRSRERVYERLMKIYGRKGEREDVKRLWNLCKEKKVFDISGYTLAIREFMRKGDIEEAYKVLEEWDTGEHRHFNVELSHLLKFRILNKRVMQTAKRIVNTAGKIIDEDPEVRQELKVVNKVDKAEVEMWKPKNLALSAYACAQHLEGGRDVDSTADVLRLLSKRGPYPSPMDHNRFSRKIVEAMRGGGYIGGDVEQE